ncbi:MAG: hypothetical protein H0V61_00870 [Chitinophagales bacterium]|nr:hypothetical protein [Chitinophagales bacterium]
MGGKKYFKQHEIEFLSLYHSFKGMIVDGTIKNNENAMQFIDILESMVESLNDIVEWRKEADEMEDIKNNSWDDASGDCPVCNETVNVTIKGETVNDLGFHVNILRCNICSTEFNDHLPTKEDELLKWYEYFFNHLIPQSDSVSNLFEIPKEELTSLRELYNDLKKNQHSIKESKRQLELIEATADRQMKAVTQYLYVIYGHTISGEDQIKLN